MLTPFDFKDYEFNNDEKIEDIFRTSPLWASKEKDNFETEEDNNGAAAARRGSTSSRSVRRGSGDGGGGSE